MPNDFLQFHLSRSSVTCAAAKTRSNQLFAGSRQRPQKTSASRFTMQWRRAAEWVDTKVDKFFQGHSDKMNILAHVFPQWSGGGEPLKMEDGGSGLWAASHLLYFFPSLSQRAIPHDKENVSLKYPKNALIPPAKNLEFENNVQESVPSFIKSKPSNVHIGRKALLLKHFCWRNSLLGRSPSSLFFREQHKNRSNVAFCCIKFMWKQTRKISLSA